MNFENLTMLKAIFDVKRQNLILASYSESVRDNLDPPFVYAIARRICPIFHYEKDSDPFTDPYETKREQVVGIFDFIADEYDKQLDEFKLTFYDLESRLGGREFRFTLIFVLRYFKLCDKFDKKVFRSVLSSCPSEANEITTQFKEQKLDL